VTLMASLKTYYVHPRHVIFLLPGFVLMASVGIVGVCRRVVRTRWVLAAAIGAVLATQAGDVLHYIASPGDFFARVKILRDMRGVVRALPPDAGRPWLLLAERESVSNAALTSYLRWYGLEQRIVFRGTRDVPEALRLLADPAVPVNRLAAPPLATVPVGLTPELRALLRIVPDTSPAPPLAGATLVLWGPPPVPPPGLAQRLLEGATLFRRAGPASPP
jgi:hypothetical protein